MDIRPTLIVILIIVATFWFLRIFGWFDILGYLGNKTFEYRTRNHELLRAQGLLEDKIAAFENQTINLNFFLGNAEKEIDEEYNKYLDRINEGKDEKTNVITLTNFLNKTSYRLSEEVSEIELDSKKCRKRQWFTLIKWIIC